MAYGLGINGLYLNMKGRERDGIVEPGDQREALLADLAERLEARKLIDRAKGRLMDEHSMSEQQAWRFLQTNAMDRRMKVHQVAQLVIDGELTP